MHRIAKVVRMLRERSPHELFTRASQEAYGWSERASLRLGYRSTASVGNANRAFAQPFFAGVSDAQKTVATLRQIAPLDFELVIKRADAMERGEIPLLGYGYVHIGANPDWQRDPFADLTAPMVHWKTLPYLDPAIVGDHKVVWEISRHQYFVTLGQAWQYSRDEKWPRLFARLLTSWLDKNPPGIGMNWASSLEVSYRAISWIWAMQLMRDASVVDAALKQRALQSLHAHGQHLERYLSTYFSPNTHLTGEALGLFYIGTQCPELSRAKKWTELGAKVLEDALSFQVLPDGVYFEQATQYHRYTIDIYLHYLLLARLAGREPAPNVASKLQGLFDVLLHLSRGDGTIPLMGDDDGGRLVQLDDRLPHDVRALLGMGAVVLGRSDLAWAGRGDDVPLCWMLGADAPTLRDSLIAQPPAENAHAFVNGGLFTMRDGWNTDDGHVAIDAGPHGALSFGHSHADALSMELTLAGRPLFVDAGTYTYVGAERDAFRTTAAHNTVEIDATSTSKPASAFRWSTVAHARATGWVSELDFDYFTGTHDGYATLSSPVEHERDVMRVSHGLWVVQDSLRSNGAHEAVLRWHCAPGLSATSEESVDGFNVIRLFESGKPRAILATFGGAGGMMHVERGWVSDQFARKTESVVLAWKERFTGNATLASIVIDTARWEVARSTVARQSVRGALGVLTLRSTDVGSARLSQMLLGGTTPMRIHDFEIIADIVIVELDGPTGQMLGFTAVGVTHATSNDVVHVPLTTQKQWLRAKREAGAASESWQIRSGPIALADASASAARRSISPATSHA
ncbi:MAG: alginate lyase family protein [Gemmatimonadaceae bacterium]